MSTLTLTHQLPPDFPMPLIDRLEEIFPMPVADTVLTSFGQQRATTLRINPLRISAAEAREQLTTAGFQLEPVPWYSDAFILTTGTLTQLSEHPLYLQGALYVQSLSSMIPPLVLNPQPQDTILDLSAAPGSKTTQLAAMMGNQGSILANDISQIRLYKLRANLERQGVLNVRTSRSPGEFLWKRYPEFFDRTLVDVPCTMDGRIQLADAKTYNDWSVRKMMGLTIKQCHLLRAAVTATKIGGEIIYSTCTLSPEENEHVVSWLLERETDRVVLEDIPLREQLEQDPHVQLHPALKQWHQKTFAPDIEKCLRILPTRTMEGFFVARLRKVASTLPRRV